MSGVIGRRTLSLLIAASLMAGCTPMIMTLAPGLDKAGMPAAFEQASGTGTWPAADWWQGFGSSELLALQTAVQHENPDIARADARLRQADARARQAGAALLPTVALNASAQSVKGTSPNTGSEYAVGVGASYEVDFWSKNRAGKLSADASLRASEADRVTVGLTVSAAIGNAYFELLSARERLALARDNLASAQAIVAVVQRRVTAGYAPASDLIQARASLAAQQVMIPALGQQELEARTELALLLGRAPEGFSVTATDLSGIAAPVLAPGLPSELLVRRPDLIAVEADLAAAHADVAVARAALLPSVSLTLDGAVKNPAFGVSMVTLGAKLVQPLFDRGRLQARTAEAEAREEELVASYRAAVLAAFGDVETALGSLAHLGEQERALADQVALSKAVLRAAQRKYAAGAADFLVVTDAQRTLYAASDQLSDMRRARLVATVALYKALGGGWSAEAR